MNYNTCNPTPRSWWRASDPLAEDWNHLLEAFAPFSGAYRAGARFFFEEKDDAFQVTALLPGCEAGEITVEVLGDFLTVKTRGKDASLAEGERYLCRERRSGSLDETMKLPGRVDAGRVIASFRNGVLTITLPREAKASPVAVKVSEAV